MIGVLLVLLCSFYPRAKYSTNFGQVERGEFGFPLHIISLVNDDLSLKMRNIGLLLLLSVAALSGSLILGARWRAFPPMVIALLPFSAVSFAYLVSVIVKLIYL